MITVSQVLGLMCHPKDISCSTVPPLLQSLFEQREKIASYWPKIEHQNTDDSMCKWGRWQTSYKKCNFTSQWMSTSFGLVFCDITDGRVIKYSFFWVYTVYRAHTSIKLLPALPLFTDCLCCLHKWQSIPTTVVRIALYYVMEINTNVAGPLCMIPSYLIVQEPAKVSSVQHCFIMHKLSHICQ